MATEASIFKSDKERADELIAALQLPPQIEKISTDIGTDSSGDDALFIHLHIAKDSIKQKDMIRTLADFSERVQVLLLGNGITRFPYVYVDEAL